MKIIKNKNSRTTLMAIRPTNHELHWPPIMPPQGLMGLSPETHYCSEWVSHYLYNRHHRDLVFSQQNFAGAALLQERGWNAIDGRTAIDSEANEIDVEEM